MRCPPTKAALLKPSLAPTTSCCVQQRQIEEMESKKTAKRRAILDMAHADWLRQQEQVH